jgi:hypothetical protein
MDRPSTFKEYTERSFASRANARAKELIHLRKLFKLYICLFCEEGLKNMPSDERCQGCEHVVCDECTDSDMFSACKVKNCHVCTANYKYDDSDSCVEHFDYCRKCVESNPIYRAQYTCTTCQRNAEYCNICVCGNTICYSCIDQYFKN